MSEPAQRQIAICYLLLKGDHWVPVSPDRRMTVRDRSSPDGPVMMAELIAKVEGTQIVGWKKRVGALFRDVGPNGEVLPDDGRFVADAVDAFFSDVLVSGPGVVGINAKIVARRRMREERQIPAHLHPSAFARAEMQILDRLNGFKAVGVRLVPIPADNTDE